MQLFAFCVHTPTVFYAKQDNSGANFRAMWQWGHETYYLVIEDTLEAAVSQLEDEVLSSRDYTLDPQWDARSDSSSWSRPTAEALTQAADYWLHSKQEERRFLLTGGPVEVPTSIPGIYNLVKHDQVPHDPLNHLLKTEIGKVALPTLVR